MTLDEYRIWAAARSRVIIGAEDEHPCLQWLGATNNRGRDPRAVMVRGHPPSTVRRHAWDLANPDAPLRQDETVRMTCECRLCVEPTHMRRITKSEAKRAPKSLRGRLNIQRVARERRSNVKDPETIVPMVQADPRPAWQLAQETGLGIEVIRDMRRGKWDNVAYPRNPFAGLGA